MVAVSSGSADAVADTSHGNSCTARRRRASKTERRLEKRTRRTAQDGAKHVEIEAAAPEVLPDPSPSMTPKSKRAKKRKRTAQTVTLNDVQENEVIPADPVLQTVGAKKKKTSKKVELENCEDTRNGILKRPSGAPAVGDALTSSSPSPEVTKVLRKLIDGPGSLSDRLNPTHSLFDKDLKQRWKTFSKKERAIILKCDQDKLSQASAEVASCIVEHPFPTIADDHCETAAEAYRDIAPLLMKLCDTLGKTPATLRIYDPYFCAGAVVRHLGNIGFTNVYNKCEDFYEVARQKREPPHDVVVTNPPYSGDHVEKLLRWCRSNGRPFLLLMPNYFCFKPYYENALGGSPAFQTVLYLYPRKRYVYWTPKGLRATDKVQAQHSTAAGNRTSPFVSFWYIDLQPAVKSRELLNFWHARSSGTGNNGSCREDPSWSSDQGSTVLCSRSELPRWVAAN
eukprot:TRINITY_DN40087_c0_g1_i1.p1 TRINITY_DN40087_c0_g1~~TRINITY_DN40087_c0_g1_i1.p1  ORF type:complete len:453 (+),score=64.08 TRINITY_DN40087_c0_g1_i1:53-1411(+)